VQRENVLKTVRVPEAVAELFGRSEEVVRRFFQDRVDDPTRGTIEIHGERYVLVRGAALSVEFFDLARSLYGADRREEADDFARSILFDLAHSIGRTDAKNFHEEMQLTDPFSKMSAGPVHFAYTGWASCDLTPDFSVGVGEEFFGAFDHPYSFESAAWLRAGRSSNFPVCIMSAGYSSGWAEASFGQKLVSMELLCRAKGDDTCRFVMAPPHRMQDQLAAYLKANPDVAERAAGARIPDFFARKREEELLKRRHDELERELRQTQKLEALGRLTGGIAHDFNNIVSVVLGQAALARRRVAAGDPLARDLEKIISAGERAAALTQQLMTFSRSHVTRDEVLGLNAVVEATVEMIERVIGDNIEVTLDLDADAGNVRADRTQLEQVLMNLTVNARDAMSGGGHLTIATRRETDQKNGADKVTLSVSDDGVGMDEATRLQAFEPFFTTKGERGTGLGLSTVYGIVANIGGSIAIDSKPGGGSKVRITLPRVEHAPTPHIDEHTQAIVGSGVVLVVDDRVDVLEVVAQSLLAFGYQALSAGSGEAALEILKNLTRRIDVLLTDVDMPRISGIELSKQAIALRPTLKVLYMSGHAGDPDHRELFRSNAAQFLQKPFAPQVLAARLAELLAS
jgi:two-component system cell cycle sensor histidine kinase/response regulator CckA